MALNHMQSPFHKHIRSQCPIHINSHSVNVLYIVIKCIKITPMLFRKNFWAVFGIILLFSSCNKKGNSAITEINKNQEELSALLQNPNIDSVSRYAIINQIANNLLLINDRQGVILFLTGWVDDHPDDIYMHTPSLVASTHYICRQDDHQPSQSKTKSPPVGR